MRHFEHFSNTWEGIVDIGLLVQEWDSDMGGPVHVVFLLFGLTSKVQIHFLKAKELWNVKIVLHTKEESSKYIISLMSGWLSLLSFLQRILRCQGYFLQGKDPNILHKYQWSNQMRTCILLPPWWLPKKILSLTWLWQF